MGIDLQVVPSSEITPAIAEFYNTTTTRQLYSVPFPALMEDVRLRRAIVVAGRAFLTETRIIEILEQQFRTQLSRSLAKLSSQLKTVLAGDRRLRDALTIIRADDADTAAHVKASGAVLARDVPRLAEQSFPLCMQTVYQGLRADGHLKHAGRMQFGLFLQGIGLPLSEALNFWQAAFSKKTPSDKFEKEYAYNFRHIYGQEGKRQMSKPKGCYSIITSTPGTGPSEHSGCPFAHAGKEKLKLVIEKVRNITHCYSIFILHRHLPSHSLFEFHFHCRTCTCAHLTGFVLFFTSSLVTSPHNLSLLPLCGVFSHLCRSSRAR